MKLLRPSQRPPKTLDVRAINWETPQKLVRLSDGQVLTVSVSSCVGDNDKVVEHNGKFLVPCVNGMAQLLPLYLRSDTLRCGGIVVPLKIKEIETQQEFASYQQLSEFHYRGHRLHGRTSALIATTDFPLLPSVLGYIQLATPFFMNKCRADLVNAPFEHGEVAWNEWDKRTSSRYINTFVRIARTVVHPEFRGLGLGQLLVKHATHFAREHWHVAGFKPLFLEIVADMLKFVPFPERAGMHYIGVTEGNLHRVGRDMAYLIGQKRKVHAGEVAREDSVGVVDLQVAYMNNALALMKKLRLRKEDLNTKLEKLMESMTLEDYEQLQTILRLPKPSFMSGLSDKASKFIVDRLEKVRPLPPKVLELSPLQPIASSITMAKLSVHYTSLVARSRKTQTVQKAFGVTPGSIKATVIKSLDLTIKPKEIVFIAGASGSGKTTLIELLMDRGQARSNMIVEGNCFVGKDTKIGVL
jgi:GNAT superfamily N-acetyltransferase